MAIEMPGRWEHAARGADHQYAVEQMTPAVDLAQDAKQNEAGGTTTADAKQEPQGQNRARKFGTDLHEVEHGQQQTGDRAQGELRLQAGLGDTVDAHLLVGADQREQEGDGRYQCEADDIEDLVQRTRKGGAA